MHWVYASLTSCAALEFAAPPSDPPNWDAAPESVEDALDCALLSAGLPAVPLSAGAAPAAGCPAVDGCPPAGGWPVADGCWAFSGWLSPACCLAHFKQ